MPGLKVSGGLGAFSSFGTQPASSPSAAAFGDQGASQTGDSPLVPNHPAGVTFWAGALGIGGLAFIRYSLPGSGSVSKRTFDLALMTIVLAHLAFGPVKMSLQRLAQEPNTTGPVDVVARAGLFILG